jgi:hypothetical protein
MIPDTLLGLGWREYRNQFKEYARCFYKRFETPTRCRCNADRPGMQIEIAVWERGNVESCEMELIGELSDGTGWRDVVVNVHPCGLPKDLDGVLALIPRMLATWEAANK